MRVLTRAFALLGRQRDGLSPVAEARGLRRGQSEQTRGILLLLASILCFTLMDATAKYLGQFYHPAQVVWARFMGNLVLVAAVYRGRFLPSLRTTQPWVQGGRALTQIASVTLFFTALQYIGIAEATAIMDLNPVLITLGGAVFLGEKIGWRRISGIVAALIGAMIIIRPGMGVFHPAAILPLFGAFTFAAGAILTRIARRDSLATSIVWSVSFGSIVSSLAVPFFWTGIEAAHLWAFLLIGVLGTGAQSLMIKAFSTAEAGVIAPFGYTGLIWAGLWGWLFFGVIPDGWTILGALIIVSAGLYIWARESRQLRAPDDGGQ